MSLFLPVKDSLDRWRILEFDDGELRLNIQNKFETVKKTPAWPVVWGSSRANPSKQCRDINRITGLSRTSKRLRLRPVVREIILEV